VTNLSTITDDFSFLEQHFWHTGHILYVPAPSKNGQAVEVV
jgi:hypothetical protein